MDLCHSNAHHGRPPQMDLLGCCTKFFAAPRNHCLHHYPSLLGGADECRKLSIFISPVVLSLTSLSPTVYLPERRAMHFQLYDTQNRERPHRLRQSPAMRAAPIHFAISRICFHHRVDIFEVCDKKFLFNFCTKKSFLSVLRLPILVKSLLIILMGTTYSLFIEISHPHIFDCYDIRVK